MTFKRPESVLVVLFDEYFRVLVLQRDDDANFWQSVTGSLEANEVPIQTAYREVLEEIGLDISKATSLSGQSKVGQIADCRLINQYVIREDWRYRYAPGTRHNFEYVFCAQIPSTTNIVLTEHLQYLWLSKQDAIQKVWSNTNKQAIERFVPKPSVDVC